MMTLKLPQPPANPPEWRRSGRFFALALVIHGVLLAYPLQKALETTSLPAPIEIKLAGPASPAKPSPQQPAADATPARKDKTAPSKSEAVHAEPLLTARSETVAPANPAPIAPVAPAPVVAEAPPRPGPAPAPSPINTLARFNAAYLNNPDPIYPPISRRLGEEGRVLLKVRVTAEGAAAAVDLEKSSGFERLDEAARQAVARWRFVPARRGDEAIEATVTVPIVFRLER